MWVEMMAMNFNEVIGNRQDEVLCIAERYGARNVCIFGSVARGEAKAISMFWWIWTRAGVCSISAGC